MQDVSKDQKATKNREEDSKKKHHPHDIPPHILKEIMDLKEKVGRLEGQMDVLLKIQK